MKTYIVKHREVTVTAYRVEADNEEAAFEVVQGGGDLELEHDIEPIPLGDEEWEAEEE